MNNQEVILEDGYVYQTGLSHQIEGCVYGYFSTMKSAIESLKVNPEDVRTPTYSPDYYSIRNSDYYIRKVRVQK